MTVQQALVVIDGTKSGQAIGNTQTRRAQPEVLGTRGGGDLELRYTEFAGVDPFELSDFICGELLALPPPTPELEA